MYRADGRWANLAHFEAPVFVGPCVVDLVGAAVEVVLVVASVVRRIVDRFFLNGLPHFGSPVFNLSEDDVSFLALFDEVVLCD